MRNGGKSNGYIGAITMTDSNESIRELIASEVAHAEAVSGPGASLSEFLLARIAEDQARYELLPLDGFDNTQLLAECEAKRRIVAECARQISLVSIQQDLADEVLRNLASPHADHPDYREEWRV